MPLSNSTTLYFLLVFVFKKDMINSDISVVLKPQIYSIFVIYKKVSKSNHCIMKRKYGFFIYAIKIIKRTLNIFNTFKYNLLKY